MTSREFAFRIICRTCRIQMENALTTDSADPHYDIVVIGLGPVGAMAAALLGQAGLRVLVVEKSRTLFDKPRAVAMDHEIMRAFQNIGIAGQIKPLTMPFSLSEHYGADGQLIRRVGMLPPPYPMGWTPNMTFLQPQTEHILREHVAGLPRVELRLGTALTDMTQDAEGVDLALSADDGSHRMERARYVIGCDGASSTVRRLLGIPLEDLGFDEPWLVIDLLANEQGLAKLPRVSTHFCEPSRPTMFVAGTGNHRRFEMMLLPGEDPREIEREERVWQLLSRWITPGDAELWRHASYRFHALIATEWRKGRVFLAGDAAHMQPPFLGQGMCQGMRDVRNLAWKLRQVISGEAGDALLDTYGAERAPHVRTLISAIKDIGRYICELDPAAARERDARLLASTNGAVKTLVRQDLMPGLEQGLLSGRARSGRGMLFPQPRIIDDGNPVLMDDVAGCGWRVVLGESALAWHLRAAESMSLLRIATTAQTGAWQEADGVVAAWFARHAGCAAIVRPDHYVYAVVDNEEELDAELLGLSQQMAASRRACPTPSSAARRRT
ncbi:MAG: bifunctional 3-(3-hydroxy-phenyl)propionate/3-hydroxycinnamic acid hydroxylase [Noviherbaspirillum sp.]|nr:bifunctional 3-(3-hydroxy-phenyl)propionate/3-hydroxycinnamic acid hydroxylase [Noviherbaspirillum sp.]